MSRVKVGTHLIIDFWGAKEIKKSSEMRELLLTATRKSNNTPLGVKIHRFKPKGISGFILLEESHISIHTWPELGFIAIDVFSCGEHSNPRKALTYFKETLNPKKVKIKEIKRGK